MAGTMSGGMPPPAPGYMGQPPPMPAKRPIGVTILGILTILFGVLGILVGLVLLLVAAVATALPLAVQAYAGLLLGLAALVTIISIIAIVAGGGLLRLRKWAWWLTIIVGVLNIVSNIGTYAIFPGNGFPFGIVLWIIILVYLVIVRSHFGIGQPKMAAPM